MVGHPWLCLIAIFASVACSISINAQFGGFEGSNPGQLPVPGPNLEGWEAVGSAVIEPVLYGPLFGPVSGFPTEAAQWLIIDSYATGNVSPPLTPGVPPPLPITMGTFARVRIPVQLPTASSVLAFEWTYVAREAQFSLYNDFITVDLTDVNGSRLANVLYRDTWSSTVSANAVTPNANNVVAPFSREETSPGSPKALAFTIPSSLFGQLAWFQIIVANVYDISFSSYAYFDNIRILGSSPPLTCYASQPYGSGSFRIVNTGVATSIDTFNLISLELAPGGLGTGPYLGLWTSDVSTLLQQFLMPAGSLPFHYLGSSTTFIFGPIWGVPSGLTIQMVAFEWLGTGLGRISSVVGLITM